MTILVVQENGLVVGAYKFLTELCKKENKKRGEEVFSYSYLKTIKEDQFPYTYKDKFLITKLDENGRK